MQESKKKCSECNSEDEKANWIAVTEVEKDGFRMFEKPKPYRYESFNIPEKKTVYYCSKLCMLRHLNSSMEIFIAEIQPEKKTMDSYKPIT
jgi:hypothetical protein